MRGRITRDVDARHPLPTLPPAGGIRLDSTDGSAAFAMPRSDVRPDDASVTFSIADIYPGRFHVRASYGWLIKSVRWNGRDYAREPLDATTTGRFDNVEVVVTNAGASIHGRVTAASEAGTATVFLFPADPQQWEEIGLMPTDIRRVRTLDDGRFVITDLRAGSYAVVALSGRSAVELHADSFRRLQGQATAVTIDWGESRTLNLRVSGEGR
jgi:hypothetical protein